MNTFAGWTLKTRKPSVAPTRIAAMPSAIGSPRARRSRRARRGRSPTARRARPSSPSVMFAAFAVVDEHERRERARRRSEVDRADDRQRDAGPAEHPVHQRRRRRGRAPTARGTSAAPRGRPCGARLHRRLAEVVEEPERREGDEARDEHPGLRGRSGRRARALRTTPATSISSPPIAGVPIFFPWRLVEEPCCRRPA